jgi:phosphatidylglycerol---prolipoprotein diacylglyceryl transferase
MHPVLWRVGAWAVPSYGFAIAVGFIAAIAVAARRAERLNGDGEAVRDLCFWLLVSSLVGARLLFVLLHISTFVHAPVRALAFWEGGLVFYGGLIAAGATAWWVGRRRGLAFARTADVLAPSVALGHFFGRIGCFLAGCCYGRECASAGARFPVGSVAFREWAPHLPASATATPPLVPVQLYEAAGELVLFVVLSALLPRKRWHGQIFVAYILAYAALRFTLELWRGDPARGLVLPYLSLSQAIALATVPLALLLARHFRAATAAD